MQCPIQDCQDRDFRSNDSGRIRTMGLFVTSRSHARPWRDSAESLREYCARLWTQTRLNRVWNGPGNWLLLPPRRSYLFRSLRSRVITHTYGICPPTALAELYIVRRMSRTRIRSHNATFSFGSHADNDTPDVSETPDVPLPQIRIIFSVSTCVSYFILF